MRRRLRLAACTAAVFSVVPFAAADSVNSPNITLNVDTNRAVGNGAGNTAVVVNTITLAEVSLPEYSAGSDRNITIQVRPGFQFDPTSNVTAQSATIGINGGAVNAVASIVPAGTADEILTFILTSGTSATVQDVIRINGIKLKISSAAGAAGPAQTTLLVTTSGAGGAFTAQGIVAANITKGAADHLVFASQPGTTQSGADILPAVKIVDFGGNLLTNDNRTISLSIQNNPVGATLLGNAQLASASGVATWADADNLNVVAAAAGFTLRAAHDGAAFLTSDSVDSDPFEITVGLPDHMVISTEPVDTPAGGAILLAVTIKDQFENTVTSSTANVSIDSAVNPGGWPLLVDTSLTKAAVNGVASWSAADNLRINKAVAGYRLAASGVGGPVQTTNFAIVAAAPAILKYVQQPTDVRQAAAMAPPVTVEIDDAFGNITTSTAVVNLTLQSACGGSLSGGSATASAGVATFNVLRVDTPCSNGVLDAASGNLPTTSSNSFAVTALPPVAVRFVQQPTSVEQGVAMNPPVTVELVDETGARTSSSATVQLTLLSSCGGALSAVSADAVNGLATFAILSVDTPCTAVAVQAASSGLIGATSNTFDVAATPAIETPDETTDLDACGACGQGAAFVLAPMLLMLSAAKRRIRARCSARSA